MGGSYILFLNKFDTNTPIDPNNIRKSENIFLKNCRLCLKIALSVVLQMFFYVQISIWTIYAIFVRRKSMYLKITKKWVRKSQVRKLPRLRKVRKYNKLFMSADLWICRSIAHLQK